MEAGLAKPRRRTGRGDPEDLIQFDGLAAGGGDRAGRHFCHFGAGVDVYAARRQVVLEAAPHTGAEVRQDGLRLGDQVELQAIRPLSPLGKEIAEPILRGEQQLRAARPGPDNTNPMRARTVQHALDQELPAIDEIVDRFDRRGEFLGPRNAGETWRRADINRKNVVGNDGAPLADDLFGLQIEQGRLVMVKARSGELA